MRGLMLALAMCASLWQPVAQAAVQELRNARSMVTVDGAMSTANTSLPYHWDRLHRAQSGGGVFEIVFSLPGEPSEPYALYFSRLGNAYEVWLNGSLLSRSGDLEQGGGADYAKAPRLFPVPPQMLQRDNLLRVVVRADGGRRAGVAAPLIGFEEEIRPIYAYAYRTRLAGSLVVALFSLLVGTMALVLWLTQPQLAPQTGAPSTGKSEPVGPRLQRDPIYLFAAIAELGWALRMGDAVIEQPPLPWPYWGIVVASAYVCWIVCMTMFAHQVIGQQTRASVRVLSAIGVSGVACAAWALWGGKPLLWTAWLGFIAIGFVAYGFYYSARALRQPNPARVLVAMAVIANVLAGLRDWLAVRLSGDFYGDGSWIRYTSVLFGLTLLYIVVTRFKSATSQAQDLMDTLAQRVAQKETELAQSYLKLETLARDQERTQERTRILRDMHDGVGSHITAAIRQLQSGKASNDQVLLTLRDSLDQLKLSIDSMNLPQGDINALLASMRYRLEPRFAASDIRLEWDVDLLPLVPRLDTQAMRQVQYMLFEALSNVLQHAGATVLRVHARADLPALQIGIAGDSAALGRQTVRVQVIDDGHGFDVSAAPRRGLAAMQERANAIGAQLRITSSAGSTVVEIAVG